METDEKPLPEKVAGVPLELVAPGSFAERLEVSMAFRDAMATDAPQGVMLRVFAAALGLSWPRCRRFMQKERVEYGGDIGKYGGKVLDFLAKQSGGVHPPDVVRAGQRAVQLCEEEVLTEGHMKEAEGFSQAPGAAPSSSSSPSNAPGANSLDGSAPSGQVAPRG